MKIIQVTQYATARVWFDDGVRGLLPEGELSSAIEAEPNARVCAPHVTLEAFVPRGGFAQYGLLGLRFEGATDTVLRVVVPYSIGDGESWSEALGAAIDDIRFGLPDEYAPSILDAAAAHAQRRFPPGRSGSLKRPLGDEAMVPFLRKRLVEQ